jgi:hypothetical protein
MIKAGSIIVIQNKITEHGMASHITQEKEAKNNACSQ